MFYSFLLYNTVVLKLFFAVMPLQKFAELATHSHKNTATKVPFSSIATLNEEKKESMKKRNIKKNNSPII